MRGSANSNAVLVRKNALLGMPDAFTSTLCASDRPAVGNVHYWKRAQILADVRYLIAKEGWSDFSLRRLANHCRMSRQTLHNIAGNRSQIAAAALCDHTAMMHNYVASRFPKEEYLLAVTEHLIDVVERTPEYSKQAIEMYFDFDLPVFQMVNKTAFYTNLNNFKHLQRRGLLRADIDLTALNARIVELHTSSILRWANGLLSMEAFASDMRMGTELILFGAFSHNDRRMGRPQIA